MSRSRAAVSRRTQFLVVGVALLVAAAGFAVNAPQARAAAGQSDLSVLSGGAGTSVTLSGSCPAGIDRFHVLATDVAGYLEVQYGPSWDYTLSGADAFGVTQGQVNVTAWCFSDTWAGGEQAPVVVTVATGGAWCTGTGCDAGQPPVVEPSSTAFGSSVWADPGESWPDAIQRTSDQFGGIKVFRWFDQAPLPWSQSNASKVLPTSVPRIYSFKLDPASVMNGSQDATILAWSNSVPAEQKVYWAFYHEPEDNVQNGDFTAAQWRGAFSRIIALTKGHANLVPTPILMAWTLDSRSGRNIADYTVPGAQVLGWDAYSHNQVRLSAANAKARNLPWLVAEYGDGDAHRGTVVDSDYLSFMQADDAVWDADPKPLAVALFHATVGGEYRLDDRPLSAAWWAARIDR